MGVSKGDWFGSLAASVLFVVLWVLLGTQAIEAARRHDFLNLYTGASMALRGEFAQLHDPALQLDREKAIVPQTTVLTPFVRPHFYAAFLAPLALLPFGTAFGIWITLQVGILIGLWVWAARNFGPEGVLWGALSLPCCMGIAHGQDCVFMLAIAVMGYVLASRERPMAAGAMWALALMKFHLILLWLPAMLISKRWKMASGFSIFATGLLSMTLVLGGFDGARSYLHLLTNPNIELLSPTPEFMIGLQGTFANLGITNSAAPAIMGLLIAAVALIAARNQPLWMWLSITTVASLAVVPHVYGYDAAIAVLPIWLIQSQASAKSLKIAAALFAFPLASLATLAGSPWSLAPSLALLLCLAALVRHTYAQAESPEDQASTNIG